MSGKLKILAISGSLREQSYNTKLLNVLKDMASGAMDMEIVRLKGIPVYDGDDEDASGVPEIVQDLAARIRAADGVLISTPEYNFSIPGGLKNATDWVSRVKNQPFKDKRVGIVGAAQSPVGTARSQYHLRQNLVGLEALTMNKPELFVSLAQNKFDADGNLTDEPSRKIFAVWLEAFEAWVRRG
jgi:chromate reductase